MIEVRAVRRAIDFGHCLTYIDSCDFLGMSIYFLLVLSIGKYV